MAALSERERQRKACTAAARLNLAMSCDLRVEAALYDGAGRVFGMPVRRFVEEMRGLVYVMREDGQDDRELPLSAIAWVRRAPR